MGAFLPIWCYTKPSWIPTWLRITVHFINFWSNRCLRDTDTTDQDISTGWSLSVLNRVYKAVYHYLRVFCRWISFKWTSNSADSPSPYILLACEGKYWVFLSFMQGWWNMQPVAFVKVGQLHHLRIVRRFYSWNGLFDSHPFCIQSQQRRMENPGQRNVGFPFPLPLLFIHFNHGVCVKIDSFYWIMQEHPLLLPKCMLYR